MKVIRFLSTNRSQPATSPFPVGNGIFFELRGGDVCHPLGSEGKWFEPPYFEKVLRFFCYIPLLPYLSYKFGSYRGYMGAKIYGADSPAYKNWMNPADVYDGSQALHFSIRFSRSG